jgi:hypothetical protein
MQEKMNMLSMGEKVVVGGAIVLLIASFLPWYDIGGELGEFGDALGISTTRSGWQSPGGIFSILAVLIGLAMAGSILAMKFGNVQMPAMGNFTLGQVFLAAGGLVVLLIIIKFLNESSHLGFGFYLGFLAALGLGVGGYLIYTEEKTGVVRS